MSNLEIAAEKSSKIAWIKLDGKMTLEFGESLKSVGLLLIKNNPLELKYEFSSCTFMDSTIMGVLTMLALECLKNKIEVLGVNAPAEIKELLESLGIHRVLKFIDQNDNDLKWKIIGNRDGINSDVILDAHKCLMNIDAANVDKFAKVVELLQLEKN